MQDAAPSPCDLLITGGVVVTVDADNRVLRDGAVAINGAHIVDVGPSSDLRRCYRANETIDAGGAVVRPGFIDAHIHVSQYTSRSVLPLMDGTSITMGDWKGALTPEDEHASASLAALDYLRAGYTGFVDPGTIFEPDAVAAVADEIGMRIWLTDPYVADRGQELAAYSPELVSPSFLARWPRSTEEALKRVGSQLYRNKIKDGRVHAFIGIYGEDTGTAELHGASLQAARDANVQFQEHRGYVPKSVHDHERELGRSMIAQLGDDGVLGPGTTFIHMNVVHAGDVPLLSVSGTKIIWCPYGQLQMIGRGDAEPRMVELYRAGTGVGLATDIPRMMNFETLGSMAIAASSAAGNPATGFEVLRMRTIGAAQTVGADREVGSIEIGKRADIVVDTVSQSKQFGLDVGVEVGVLGLTFPRHVIINGEVVWRDRRPRMEIQPIVDRARRSCRAVASRIGLS